MELEPFDGSTLTDDELEVIRALERQFAVDDEDGAEDEPVRRLGWRARLGLALWSAGGALAIATVLGATPLGFVAGAVALAGFGLLLTEL